MQHGNFKLNGTTTTSTTTKPIKGDELYNYN